MSDTRKVLVVTDNRTIIKKIKVGTPIANISSAGLSTASISDINATNPSAGDILVYQPSTGVYYTAALTGGTNLEVVYDSSTRDVLTVNTTLDSLSGSIIPDSNEVYDLGSSSKKFRDLYLSGSTLTLGTLQLQDSSGAFVVKDSDGNTVFTEVSLTTDNSNMLSFDSASGMFTFRADGFTVDSATIGGINLSGNDLTTTGKLYFANVFSNVGDLPDASTYHGMFAHVHATGSAYFAHAGNWVKLLDSDGFNLSAGTGLTYVNSAREFSITDTGVSAGSYGSSTTVPQISINAQGQIDSARNITISGVTGVDFDSATGTLTVQTTGGDFSDVITLDPYSTSNLVEGSNLYYTTARADSDAKNAISVTDAGGDGSLSYNSANGIITYTGPGAAEVRAHFQAGTGVTYDSASGTLSIGQDVGISDNVTFNNLVVSGNLTVSGSTTTINTETIQLADNEIVLNSNFDSGTPTENGGITIRRGDEASKELVWNETIDKWTVGTETFVAGTFEGNLTGNVTGQVSDISNHSTTDLSEGSNLYYTTARADSDAKNAISVTDAGGDGSMSYNAGTGVITYTGPSASEVRAHLVEGTGLTYDSASGVFSITNTGVTAGTYGSASLVPVVTVNAQGQIDSIGTVSVAGVSSTAWDSSTSQFTINTADGGTYSTTINGFGDGQALFFGDANDFQIIHNGSHTVLRDGGQGNLFIEGSKIHLSSQNNGNPIFLTTGDNDGVKLFDSSGDLRLATNSTGVRITGALEFDTLTNTTTDITEGNNLYYTSTRADSDFDIRFATKTTDNLTQGSSNLYFTTARVRNVMVAGTGITYDSSTGVIASAYQPVDTTDSVTFSGLYVSGNTVLGGNLTVTGTTTTVNTETINLADNTILLNSNHTGSATQSAGIEIERGTDSNTSLLWDEAADRWSIGSNNFAAGTFIGNLTGQASDISNHTTDDLTQGSTNLYYDSATTETTARYSLSVTDAGGDGSLTYNKGTGVFTYTGPSASEVRSHINVSGDLAYDSSTGQISFTQRTEQQVRNIFSVSGDLAYDSNTGQFSFTQRTDQGVRNLFSASGDLSYDSSTGQFSFDVEQVYTKANFDSDFDVRLGEKTTTDLSEGNNLYYTTARADSDAKNAISVTDAGGDGSLSYNAGTGVITYTGPSATEVRSHLSVSGDLAYDSATGQFSFTERTDAEVRNLMVAGTGVTYDSSTGVIAIGQSVGTTDDVTFGKVTQDSAVANSIQLNRLQGRPNNTAGTLFFDSDHQKALSVNMSTRENANPDVTLNIGQEIFLYVHNLTGAAINNGDAVYISGTAHGKHPQVTKARANTSATGNPTGLATMDIPDGGHGWVTRYGLVRDVNTGGMTAGNVLYLSPDSDGVVTETPVTVDTGYPFHIGRVVTVDSTNGVILVDGMSEHFDDLRVENKLKASQIVADSASLLHVQFDTTTFDSHQPYSEGLLYYDNKHKTLNYNDDITGMIHEVGTQEHQRVFNNTGSTIKKGQPLYFSGNYTSGDIDVPTVGLADATDVNAYNAQGIAALDIANNSYGHCLIAGQLTEVNTEGLSDGTNFFVGLGPGLVQNASPTYPNFPMCLGWVVNSGDSNTGILLVNQQNHSVNSFRVRTSAHIGTDLQVDGNLTILGSQTTVGQSNVTQGAPFYRLNEGDAIGEAGTTFTGSGLDDAFFAGHFTGTSPQTYYVRIDGVGTGAGGVDTFAVALGNDSTFSSPIITKEEITTNDQLIHSADNISVNFGAATGHDSGDTWKGTASPINVDTGFFTNRNTGTSGVGYTHMGFFFDVSDEKWKLIDEYDSTPTGTIAVTDSSLGIMVAAGFEGPLTGAVTGNASTATALAAGRDFSLTGDITASAVSFDGTGAVQLTTAYNPGSIVNADINASAAIADSKLATISTAGKVQNSATTATNANTGSTIVARDASGNFEAGTVTLDNLFVGNLHVDSADIISLAQSVSINNVVEDTSPQLGGDLDTNGNNITFGDNDKAIFGAGSDLKIYHDGSNSYITDSGTGNLIIGGDNVQITTASGTRYFEGSSNIARLYNTGNQKLATHTSGIVVTGNIILSGTVDGRDVATDGSKLDGIEASAKDDQTITAGNGLSGGGTGDVTLNIDSANVRGMFSAGGDLSYNSGTGQFSFSETYSTPAELLTALQTVDSDVGGLNASTLDGQEGTYYRINVYNSSGTLLN